MHYKPVRFCNWLNQYQPLRRYQFPLRKLMLSQQRLSQRPILLEPANLITPNDSQFPEWTLTVVWCDRIHQLNKRKSKNSYKRHFFITMTIASYKHPICVCVFFCFERIVTKNTHTVSAYFVTVFPKA